jgi:hypothetical protein
MIGPTILMRSTCQPTQTSRNCSPRAPSTGPDQERVRQLTDQLRDVLDQQGVRVKQSPLRHFAEHLNEATRRAERQKRILSLAGRLAKTDILYWITKARESEDQDEVLWRCFLAAHFGRTSTDDPEKATSASRFLCGFSTKPYWTWKRTSTHPSALRDWLLGHRAELASLGYGNHRKYESKQSTHLYRGFESFLEWVQEHGGSAAKAFTIAPEAHAEARFDALFQRLKKLHRFGRTGVFDLLCLTGGLGVLAVRPGSCYLRGSTGPLAGARKLWGKRKTSELSYLADRTARLLRISFDVFEDALCTWQK